jgi:cation transport regulator ChaB
MPCRDIADLPNAVRSYSPPRAQEIYVAAFNNTWQQHAGEPEGMTSPKA